MIRRVNAVSMLLLCSAALGSWADGAGGMTLGYYMSSNPLIQRYNLPANGGDMMYFGGFGYGVGRHGVINGGFGFALKGTDPSDGACGGIGGYITGIRILRVPLHLALVSWTGVGGVYTGGDDAKGYFAGLEEVDLEVGLPIARWFMPVAYVGYQVTGNLAPGLPLREHVTYAPVAGLRIAWGALR